MCKVDYEEDGKYFTLFLALSLENRVKFLKDEQNYMCIFIDDNYYDDITQYCKILREKELILPLRDIEFVGEELIDTSSILGKYANNNFVLKNLVYKTKDNKTFKEMKYEIRR